MFPPVQLTGYTILILESIFLGSRTVYSPSKIAKSTDTLDMLSIKLPLELQRVMGVD